MDTKISLLLMALVQSASSLTFNGVTTTPLKVTGEADCTRDIEAKLALVSVREGDVVSAL